MITTDKRTSIVKLVKSFLYPSDWRKVSVITGAQTNKQKWLHEKYLSD